MSDSPTLKNGQNLIKSNVSQRQLDRFTGTKPQKRQHGGQLSAYEAILVKFSRVRACSACNVMKPLSSTKSCISGCRPGVACFKLWFTFMGLLQDISESFIYMFPNSVPIIWRNSCFGLFRAPSGPPQCYNYSVKQSLIQSHTVFKVFLSQIACMILRQTQPRHCM